MAKRLSNKKPSTHQIGALVDPQSWINARNYGELKSWMREATRHRIFLPLVIPHNVIPVSYLVQLLTRAQPRIKTHLRTIVPELIKEWGTHDDRESLDDLLILAGNLNCNEAEAPISRIITEKLTDEPRDVQLRRRALSVLQGIGTDKSLHLFKRYIGDYDYAAVCYRSLYMLNLEYAVTEFNDLMKLYHRHDVADELEDVFKVLFKYTLKPPQYIYVLQPLVDQLPPESFVEVLELLKSIDVLKEKYFAQLSSKSQAHMIKQIMQRAREEDFENISALLLAVGAEVKPPAYPIVTEDPADAKTKRKAAGKRPVKTKQSFFSLNVSDDSSGSEDMRLISTAELGDDKSWILMREFMPDPNSIIFELDRVN